MVWINMYKKGEKINILYVPNLNLGVVAWRIENYANCLNRLGYNVHVDYFLPPDSKWSWDAGVDKGLNKEIIDRMLLAPKHFDVIIFQRLQGEFGISVLNEIHKQFPDTPLIMENDDSIGDTSPSSKYLDMIRDQHSISAYHASVSTGVITSTEYLKRDMARFNDNIHIAPNCIDTGWWNIDKVNDRSRKDIKIGYVAGGGHDEDLWMVYSSMLKMLDKFPNVKWVIRYGGGRPEWLKSHDRIDFKSIGWHVSEYHKKLFNLKLDIMLAPLRDTNFNRCKSNVKWLESAIYGIPLVASNVEPYSNTKGKIFLTSNDSEAWYNQISNVVEILEEQKVEAWDLRKQCLKAYNLESECEKLAKWLCSML